MKVLIADDDETVRLIGDSLAELQDVKVQSTNDGLVASKALLQAEPPDVAILNCSLPSVDGIELCRKLREQQNDTYTHVILVSDGNIREVFRSLADGFYNLLMKPLERQELRDMVNGLPASRVRAGTSMAEPLTPRQQEILTFLAKGHSNIVIAAHLGVSVGTIKSHIHHIFEKLSAGSRTKAVLTAQEMGLI